MDALQLLNFLRGHRVAAQATVSAGGSVQAAVVGIAVSDRFEIVFDTVRSSRKASNIRHSPWVALVIGGFEERDERTAQVEGVADEPSGSELERIRQAYYAVYPDGVERSTWPDLMYVRVRPTWVRYSDFNVTPPLIVEFTGEELARAVEPS